MQNEPIDYAPAPPPAPRWKDLRPVPMMLLTVRMGLNTGVLAGTAIIGWLVGQPFLVWKTDGTPGSSSYLSGWGISVGAAAVLAGMASVLNRIRREMLNPVLRPAPRSEQEIER